MLHGARRCSGFARAAGGREQRHFTRVVIETDQDTAPILRTFATKRALGAEFYVEDAPPLPGHRFTLAEDAPLDWEEFSASS